MTDPRYPVGRFEVPAAPVFPAEKEPLISEIERIPAGLRSALAGLEDAQLDTPYCKGGTSLRERMGSG